VARERFGDALWAVRACEPLYTTNQIKNRKRKTIDVAAPALASAYQASLVRDIVAQNQLRVNRIRSEISRLQAELNQATSLYGPERVIIWKHSGHAAKALCKFGLDLSKLEPPAAAAAVADAPA
jgi:hypothetical protein